MTTAQALTPQEAQQLKVVFSPLRPDLIFQRQIFKGEAYYVIKDPLSLTYFRLQPEEAYLLQLLDGKRNLETIIRDFSHEFPQAQREPKEVLMFCNQLARSGLLNIPARSFVDFASQKPKMFNSLFMLWVKLISKLLFFKIPLIDPSPWLGRMVHAIRFFWNPYVVWSLLGLYVCTFLWVFFHWTQISAYASQTSFFSPESLGLIWMATVIIKTCHEFGHATTCRYFGGEVHEMGVCCICTMPCGYVDASDAWMMRKKAHKVYTTIAGIFIELLLACIAIACWYNLSEGFAKELMFRAMVIASINTVFFNMNPLMKFDGYYVLSDLLEIPNLRTKAITYCSYHMQRLLFGYRNTLQEATLQGDSRQWVFIIYAVAAYFYMATIIYGLTQVFARFLENYELKEFGLILGIAAQVSFLLSPIFKIFYDAFKPGTHIVRLEPVWRRLTKWGIALFVLGIIFLVWPVHFKVEGQGVILPEAYVSVTTPMPGFLTQLDVSTGERVHAGQFLGRLQNTELQSALETAQIDLELAQLQLAQAELAPELGRGPSASFAWERAHLNYQEAVRRYEALTLYSPIDGIVITQDLHTKLGDYFSAEAPIFEVTDLQKLKIVIPIKEEEIGMLEAGGAMSVRVMASGRHFDTTLSSISDAKAMPQEYLHAMVELFGGPIAMSILMQQSSPTQVGVFFVQAPILGGQQGIQPSMRAQATITGVKTTLLFKWWRQFLNFWNLRSTRGLKNPFSQT